MTREPLPSPELLRKLLRYEPETGLLFWRERGVEFFKAGYRSAKGNMNQWNSAWAGKEAFTAVNAGGYKHGRIFCRLHLAHRVIFAIHHGYWPENQIDHNNGIRASNKIKNLSVVNNQGNQRNTHMRKDNTSGFTGVCWDTKSKKWMAYIMVDARQLHLGHFSNLPDAITARKAANAKYGFSKRHGVKV